MPLSASLDPSSLYSSLEWARAARDLRMGFFLGVLKEYAVRGDEHADRKPSFYCNFHDWEVKAGGGNSQMLGEVTL